MKARQNRPRLLLHSRLLSSPQRYNTLDFPMENRVPRGTLSPLDSPAKGNAVSLWKPYANRDAARPYWMTQSQGASSAPLDTPMFSARLSRALICAGFASPEHAKQAQIFAFTRNEFLYLLCADCTYEKARHQPAKYCATVRISRSTVRNFIARIHII